MADSIQIVPRQENEGMIQNADAQMAVIRAAVQEIMMPVMQNMAEIMQHTNEALTAIALQQEAQTRRMDALEKQVSWSTTVTARQARYLNEGIRERAALLLAKHGVTDRKRITRLANIIRKTVFARYGIGSISEVPRCEYPVAQKMISDWLSVQKIREIVRP